MKKYLNVTVTAWSGVIFSNPLKVSESRFIVQLAKENKSVRVSYEETTSAHYKSMFGA